MVSVKDISPSSGSDPETLASETTHLVDQGRWHLCKEGRGIEREFKFKTFKATWAFMDEVAAECKKAKHHPEWTNIYNRTFVRWTTHSPEGLSERDVRMARFCDEVASAQGEVVEEGKGKGMELDGRLSGGECCGGGDGKKAAS